MKNSAIILSVLLIFSSCAVDSVLFENGESDYSIVIDKEAPASEQYAAEELQTWIREVSGVTLPIVGLDAGEQGKRLVVGYNPIVAENIRDELEDAEKYAKKALKWRDASPELSQLAANLAHQ